MGLPASPLSFSSNNLSLSGSSGLVASSLPRQIGSNVLRPDQQEQHLFQQLQQASTQFPLEALQQQELEQQSQGEVVLTGQQIQGQQMLGAGINHVQSQQGLEVQQLKSMPGLSSIKLEHQMSHQAQSMQCLSSKVEQHIDPSLIQQSQPQQHVQALQGLLPSQQNDQSIDRHFSASKVEMKMEDEFSQQVVQQQSILTSHLQRQEALHLHRQQSQQLQAQMNILQQQRLLHQQQQQQLLQTLPQQLQRTQFQQQQLQQHLQQQMVGPAKQLVFETGICARRLMQYVLNQRHRPPDNDIGFWRKFVAEYFAPRAKKRWCVSLYGNNGRQPTGVFPQDVWHCEICGSRPGRGFETTVEVLPRLCKIKYDSGILDELLYVDVPLEKRLSSGLMVLQYHKAIQESIFDQLRVVRDGQLRIIFTPDLKIISWEFCARSHEELLPRRLLVPQVTQLAAVAQKYQSSANQNQNGAAGVSTQDLQTNCHLFVESARQLAKTLEAPTVNDLGYTKRYVRCLQISEVVNSMKDLIDFSRETGMGPMASLINFPRRSASSGVHSNQAQQQQDPVGLQPIITDQSTGQVNSVSFSANSSLNDTLNSQLTNSSSSLTVLHNQSSLTSLQNSLPNNVSSLANSVNLGANGSLPSALNLPHASALNSVQNFHPSVSGQPPLSALSNSVQQIPLSSTVSLLQQSVGQSALSNQLENSNTVNHLLQEMMMPSQLKGGGVFFPQGLGGGSVAANVGLSACLGGVGNSLSHMNGSTAPGNGSGLLGGSSSVAGNAFGVSNNANNGNLVGISSNGMNLNILSGSGNNLRNLSTNTVVNSLGVLNALGGRLNLSAMVQEQNFGMQDPTHSLHQELGGSGVLSGLGSTNLPFNWKSS